MGLEDIVDKAKGLIDGTPAVKDAVEGGVDQVKDAVEEKTPDQVDGMVDQAAQAVKDQI